MKASSGLCVKLKNIVRAQEFDRAHGKKDERDGQRVQALVEDNGQIKNLQQIHKYHWQQTTKYTTTRHPKTLHSQTKPNTIENFEHRHATGCNRPAMCTIQLLMGFFTR